MIFPLPQAQIGRGSKNRMPLIRTLVSSRFSGVRIFVPQAQGELLEIAIEIPDRIRYSLMEGRRRQPARIPESRSGSITPFCESGWFAIWIKALDELRFHNRCYANPIV
jgi:hypothetical protein